MFNVDSNTVKQEQAGVWKEYKGSRFLIAHINNPVFQKIYTRLQLPHRKAIDKGRLDPDIQVDIVAKSLSKGILLDWQDVIDNSNNKIPYSVDAAERVLKHNSEFRDFVMAVAEDISQFVEEERDELGKDRKTSSDGS